MAARKIIVVGGGLAGLAAVIEIAEAGGTVAPSGEPAFIRR